MRSSTRCASVWTLWVQAAAGAVAASDQKSRFLASMSHEFRTPLNAILGFSEAMEQELFGEIEGGGAEKYREYIRHIHSSGAHLLSLINDLLDLSKIEAGKHELNRSAVKVEDILDDVGRMTGPQSAAAGVELAIGFAAENGLTTHADRRVLTQAVLNVTANALRFAPRGSRVMIEVTEQGGNIVLAVSDEGCGIAKSELDRIMEPFGQAAIQAQGQKGTGLGLPISASIMQMHGGGLEIESEPGQGTRVSLWWPKDLRTEKSRNADVVSLPDVHSPRGHRTSGCEKTLSEVI